METHKKNRKVHRALFTKSANELELLLSAEVKQHQDINIAWEVLNNKYTAIQGIDEDIYSALLETDVTEADLTAELEGRDNYFKRYTTLRLRLDEYERQQQDESFSNSQGKRTFKLPIIEFKKFSGDIREWLGFWAQFRKIHEDPNIDSHDKISYLIQATVEGSRARRLVESFPAMQENYTKIIDSLKSRFGREDLQTEVYVRELLSLILNNSMSPNKMDISTLYDRIETQLRALETLGITKNNCAAILFPLIESCLPEHLLRAWQRSSGFSNSAPTVGISAGSSEDLVQQAPLERRLELLMEFLRAEVESEQRIVLAAENFGLKASTSKSQFSGERKQKQQYSEVRVPTAAGLVNCDVVTKCIFCDGHHESEACFKAQKFTYDQKKEILSKKKACYRCLKVGHTSQRCRGRQKCLICSRSHVTFICPDLSLQSGKSEGIKSNLSQLRSQSASQGGSRQDEIHTSDQVLSSQACAQVFLQTLKVNCTNGWRSRKIRVLLDTGSQRSYILQSVAESLGYEPLRSEKVIHSLFGGQSTSEQNHNCYRVRLCEENYSCTLEVLDQPQICSQIQAVFDGGWMGELRALGIYLSDVSESGPIEMLLGADVIGKLYTGRRHILKCGLIAMETLLGWTLSGKIPTSEKTCSMTSTCLSLFVNDLPVSNLWKLDVLGITDPTETKTREEMALSAKMMFNDTVTIDKEGRYKVRLPWLEGHPILPTFYSVAKKRLDFTLRKLQLGNLVESYNQVFQDWLEEEIIEVVPEVEIDKPAHYLAHRPVIKKDSTTAIRPVFDASACEKGKPSLNSCLEVGPNLIESIPSILLRFRTSRLGVVSDIRKAFLQISLHEEDRDFLRFIWFGPNGQEVIFRHRRVVFGVSSSPFLLGATIEHHLHLCKEKCLKAGADYTMDTLDKLSNSFYVDNCVTSIPNEKALQKFIRESVCIMAEAKFDLRGWEYTNSLLTDANHHSEDICEEHAAVSVLGLIWDPNKDILKVNPECIAGPEEENKAITKRQILSIAQKIFDPIGFTCAVTLCPKILLQKMWSQKTGWDTPVSDDIQQEFLKWRKGLPYLLNIEIPRWIHAGPGEAQHLSLHTFCDASKDAYSAVVFLRAAMENQVHIYLLAAKSRVAPLKKISIPRLELLAATIGSRLCVSIKENFDQDIEVYFWSDSTAVVAWISRVDEWATFVGNRVKEIRSITPPDSWKHLPGSVNPADLPSRGCSARHLYESRWWEGPAWLYEASSQWPYSRIPCDEEEVNQERKKRVATMLDHSCDFWHLNYFSKYSKTLRMIAWILRFLNNVKKSKEKIQGPLSAQEIDRAENLVLRVIQDESFEGGGDKKLQTLQAFKDKDGLLRLKTKVSNREDSAAFCFPIVLPGKHRLVNSLIFGIHEKSLHVGTQGLLSILREKYWIIGGRRVVRAAISKCVVCQMQSAKSFQVETPPLPENRVRDAVAFEVIGIDFAGPVFLRSGEKAWVCLFTCAVYRAVHLELTTSLSTASFMQALRRFVARRGRPRVIYTDNGTNFVGSENAFSRLNWDSIQEYAALERIMWHFNPPTAAWWGGFWERLIGVMKRLLRKVLGNACLTYESLLTLLCECENIINARPITYMSSDPSDLIALTPAMFLRDNKDSRMPDCDVVDRESLSRKVRYIQRLREDLRRRFRLEYLGELKLYSDRKPNRVVKVGDVVLVGNDCQKRLDWPIARVVELFPNQDGKTRLVKVLTSKGYLLRPVQRLFPLEFEELDQERLIPELPVPTCDVPDMDEAQSQPCSVVDSAGVPHVISDMKSRVSEIKVTRSGRISKLPQRYC